MGLIRFKNRLVIKSRNTRIYARWRSLQKLRLLRSMDSNDTVRQKFHETHKQSNSERVVTSTAKTKMSLRILM